MNYYIESDGGVWAFESDGSQDFRITTTMRAMTAEEVAAHVNPPPTYEQLEAIEAVWRESEIIAITNQLLAIEEAEAAAEDGEAPPEDLLPGTRNQWLAYRTKVRAWKEGNPEFPGMLLRPERPV